MSGRLKQLSKTDQRWIDPALQGSNFSRKILRAAPKKVLDEMKAEGWTIEPTGGGHVKWLHPNGAIVYSAATPSDRRAWDNHLSQMRRSKTKPPLRGSGTRRARTTGLAAQRRSKSRTRLGAPPEIHRIRAFDNAAVARGAIEAARGALQRGDCEMAWGSITHAAENVGMLAANADSGGADYQPRMNRLPAGDPYGRVRGDLLTVMEQAASRCFRRKR